jgi:hypothetical protein
VSAYSRFTATSEQVDPAELSKLVANARHSVFFQMFMPGADLFNHVVEKSKTLYVRGVANTFPNVGVSDNAVDVALVDGKG